MTAFETWLADLAPEHRTLILGWLKSDNAAIRVARAIREDEPDEGYTGYPATHQTVIDWRRTHGVG